MATAVMVELLTAEQFGQRPDPGYPEELVQGRVVALSVPDRRHGYVCGRVDRVLAVDVRAGDVQRLGRDHRALRYRAEEPMLPITATHDSPRVSSDGIWARSPDSSSTSLE